MCKLSDKNSSCQRLPVSPNLYVSFTSGIRLPSKSADTIIASVSASPSVKLPPMTTLPVNSALPVTVNCVPLNVKLALSSISPLVPANTTRPAVKSSTCSDAISADVPTSSVATSKSPAITVLPVAPAIVSLFRPTPKAKSPVAPSCSLLTPAVSISI